MLNFLAALLPTDDLATDARLQVPFTVAERFLPLPEFARRAQVASKETVRIDPRMATRKLTLFVEKRPLAETMAQVADVLGGIWTGANGARVLVPDPAVAKDEESAEKADALLDRRGVGEWLRKETLKSRAKKDPRSTKIGEAVLQVGLEHALDTLMTGKPLILTGDGRFKTIEVPMEDFYAGSKMLTLQGTLVPPNGMVIVRRDPSTGNIRTLNRTLGIGDNTMASSGDTDPRNELPSEPTDLDRRIQSWVDEGDQGFEERPLQPLPPVSDPYGAGLAPLADVLERFHVRAGVPVVAESLRVPIARWGEFAGSTIGEATKTVRQNPPFAGFSWVSRGKNGWLEARFLEAWRLRPGEISESRLVPLERKHLPTLDDYASLAGSLDESQRVALDQWRPVASFPTVALRRGFWGLYVCDAVPSDLRGQPTRLEDLPALARDRWDRAVTELAFEGQGTEQWLNAVLSGRRPKGAGFAVIDDNGGLYPADYDRSRNIPQDTYATFSCWTFLFGNDAKAMRVSAPTVRKAP